MLHRVRYFSSICLCIFIAYTPLCFAESRTDDNKKTALSPNTELTSTKLPSKKQPSKKLPSTASSRKKIATTANSGQLYITDDLSTALRSGAGTRFRIIAFLKSGTPLQAKPQDNRDTSTEPWTRVATMNGTVGWINSSHLSIETPAKQQVVELQDQMDALTATLQQTDNSSTQTTHKISQLTSERNTLTQQLINTQADYQHLQSISKNAIQIDEDNKRLTQELALIKVRLEDLSIENGQLKESEYIDGITHGVFALIIGCLLTLILPRLTSVKKRSNGWD